MGSLAHPSPYWHRSPRRETQWGPVETWRLLTLSDLKPFYSSLFGILFDISMFRMAIWLKKSNVQWVQPLQPADESPTKRELHNNKYIYHVFCCLCCSHQCSCVWDVSTCVDGDACLLLSLHLHHLNQFKVQPHIICLLYTYAYDYVSQTNINPVQLKKKPKGNRFLTTNKQTSVICGILCMFHFPL